MKKTEDLKAEIRQLKDLSLNNHLALYDVIFKRHELKMRVKDGDITHTIYISRLRTSGLIIDVNKKYGLLNVHDLTHVEMNLDQYPSYMREVISAADAKRRELYGGELCR